jgi:hypothetical protein
MNIKRFDMTNPVATQVTTDAINAAFAAAEATDTIFTDGAIRAAQATALEPANVLLAQQKLADILKANNVDAVVKGSGGTIVDFNVAA